jgi:hypothetical protein
MTSSTKGSKLQNFNKNEVESDQKSVKPGTAAGFDGVYPEFISNCAETTKEWIIIVQTG